MPLHIRIHGSTTPCSTTIKEGDVVYCIGQVRIEAHKTGDVMYEQASRAGLAFYRVTSTKGMA